MSAETPTRTEQSTWARIRHGIQEWAAERDMILLVLLAGVLTGALFGTIAGLSHLFPFEVAVVAGTSLSLMLFALESGGAGTHAPFKRWTGVLVISAVSVYCQIFQYAGMLGKERDMLNGIDKAAQQHAQLVDTIYAPRKNEARRLQQLADAKYTQSEAEKAAGGRTGAQGYGPVARELRRQGDEYATQAAELTATIEDLRAFAEFDPGTVGPEGTYERDLKLWQNAPAVWKTDVAKPEREAYVDLTAELGLLMPVMRLAVWDENGRWTPDEVALSATFMALGIDGFALFLGLAIEIRKKDTRPIAQRMAEWYVQGRQARETLRHAREMPVEHIEIRDPLRTMHLRLTGERHAADFWDLQYLHTHPLSGRFDYTRLLEHENEAVRRNTRYWIDVARANGMLIDTGAEDEAEALYVPEDAYFPVTHFYREASQREAAYRDKLPPLEEGKIPERTMRALLPEPIKRKEGEPVKLMRPLSTASSKKTTVAATTVTAQAPVTPLRGSSVPVVAAPGALRAASQTIVPDDTPRTAQPAPTPTTTRSPMAFARGGSYAHSTAHTTAPQLRVVTPPPPDVTAGAPTLEADDVTVQSAPVRVDAPVSRLQAPVGQDPPLVPVEDEIATTLVVEDSEDAPVDAVAQNPDEEDTHPSIMMDVAELPPVVEEPIAEVVPEPTPVPAPVAAMAPPPEWDPDMWEEDKPTATRGVSRAKLRAATMDGAAGQTGIRDDALRTGSLVRLSYMTKPPRTQNGGDAYAPRVRAHLRQAAAEALARGGK